MLIRREAAPPFELLTPGECNNNICPPFFPFPFFGGTIQGVEGRKRPPLFKRGRQLSEKHLLGVGESFLLFEPSFLAPFFAFCPPPIFFSSFPLSHSHFARRRNSFLSLFSSPTRLRYLWPGPFSLFSSFFRP